MCPDPLSLFVITLLSLWLFMVLTLMAGLAIRFLDPVYCKPLIGLGFFTTPHVVIQFVQVAHFPNINI